MSITKHHAQRRAAMRVDTHRPRPLTEAELDERNASWTPPRPLPPTPSPAEAATDLGAHVGDTDFAVDAERARRRSRAWELLLVVFIAGAALGAAIAVLGGPRP